MTQQPKKLKENKKDWEKEFDNIFNSAGFDHADEGFGEDWISGRSRIKSFIRSQILQAKKEVIVYLEKQLSGYDDGKRTGNERQLLFRVNKLLDALKAKL